MIMRRLLPFFLYLFLCSTTISIAQTEVHIKSNDVTLYGTLQEPNNSTDTVVLIISGSGETNSCLLYTSPSPRDQRGSRMPSSA